LNILHAVTDANLFAPWFKKPEAWRSWFAFLAALFGLPLTDTQLRIFQHHTGRVVAPITQATEGWLICGRRAGKSFMLALCAVYLACFKDYSPHLMKGERATIMIIARDRRQARVILRYIRGLLQNIRMLKELIERETSDGFDLTNHVTIETTTASFRATRGYTLAAALCDELAFWPTDDSAEPDYEVLSALRPGMVTIPGAMLLCASSPYARRGALWDAYHRYFGKEGEVLVWKATTKEMHPGVSQRAIDADFERDPAHAAAEWLAEFRTDVESFLSREAVEACVSPGVHERSPITGTVYSAFADPSGGSSDSMTLAIGHREGNVAMIDAIRERKPPFMPDAVALEFAELLKSYRVGAVTGDRYGGEWPRDAFKRHGIEYVPAVKTKSEIYHELLPKVNGHEVALLDHPKLTAQLVNLERRTARGGKDSIDHAPGGKDDVANAVAGVAYLLRAAAPMTFAPAVIITRPRMNPYEPYGITIEDGTYHG
jgi:terminase large subunit-like protein